MDSGWLHQAVVDVHCTPGRDQGTRRPKDVLIVTAYGGEHKIAFIVSFLFCHLSRNASEQKEKILLHKISCIQKKTDFFMFYRALLKILYIFGILCRVHDRYKRTSRATPGRTTAGGDLSPPFRSPCPPRPSKTTTLLLIDQQSG